MTTNNSLKVLNWKDIKNDINKINPWFYQKAEQVDGVDNFKVLKVSYPYGQDIIKNGQFHLNINGQSQPFSQLKQDKQLAKLLDYNWQTIPFGMILNNSAESHIAHPSHIIPFMLQLPGQLFSLLSIFDKSEHPYFIPEIYSTKSGCRSLLLLPKIKDAQANERLTRHLGITEHLSPNELSEQWPLFMEMLNSKSADMNWNVEICFFSQDFAKPSAKTQLFHHQLLDYIWQATGFERFQFMYELIWSTFLQDLPLAIRNDAYAIQTVKQLLNIALGEAPGHTPVTSDIAGPVSQLSDMLLNVYRLRYYYPVFMQLANFNGKDPLYYTIQNPSFFYEIPKKTTTKQTMNQLLKIIKILTTFTDYILDNKFSYSLQNTPLYKVLETVTFDFYHPKSDDELVSGDIMKMVDEDSRFFARMYEDSANKHLDFPVHSMFFHGCIRIQTKK